ncbi:MAG: F0F1 ATP synthase subunit B [Clostridia bacterium]
MVKPFVTLDTWTLIFTWVNLLILFLLVKKLFFKPIQKMLKEREDEINSSYSKAETAQKDAEDMRTSYQEKLSNAQSEAGRIVSDAVNNAQMRSDSIVKEAEEKAQDMITKAQKSIDAQKESAFNELQGEISSMAVEIAEKIIKKDIDEKKHHELIESALEGLGASNE